MKKFLSRFLSKFVFYINILYIIFKSFNLSFIIFAYKRDLSLNYFKFKQAL